MSDSLAERIFSGWAQGIAQGTISIMDGTRLRKDEIGRRAAEVLGAIDWAQLGDLARHAAKGFEEEPRHRRKPPRELHEDQAAYWDDGEDR